MAPDQEVRAAALNAAIMHHKHFLAPGNGLMVPTPKSIKEILETAKTFELHINGGDEV